MQALGQELRIERLKRRLTQWDIFELAGIRPARVSLVERGRVEPKPAELERWRQALGIERQDGDTTHK